MFVITQEQIREFEKLIDEPWTYLGASMSSQKPDFVLKAINDEIKANGNDWQYELNEKGRKLQKLYEEIYAASYPEEMAEKSRRKEAQ